MRKKFLLGMLLATIFVSAALGAQTKYPVTIQNGPVSCTYEKAPERMVTNCDANIIDYVFALGLEDHMIGYAGFPAYGNNVAPEYREKLKNIPMLSSGYITLETLLAAVPDFYFSGYNYGIDIPSAGLINAITPKELKNFGINFYAINESLIRVMNKPKTSFEDVFIDIKNLGIIFDIQDRAEELTKNLKSKISSITDVLEAKGRKSFRGLLIDTYRDIDQPQSVLASQAFPTALLELLGGKNVFEDINDSYVQASWESILERKPEVIFIFETGNVQGSIWKEHFLNDPMFKDIEAVKNKQIFIHRVEEVYPSPRAVTGFEMMAMDLYPEFIKDFEKK